MPTKLSKKSLEEVKTKLRSLTTISGAVSSYKLPISAAYSVVLFAMDANKKLLDQEKLCVVVNEKTNTGITAINLSEDERYKDFGFRNGIMISVEQACHIINLTERFAKLTALC